MGGADEGVPGRGGRSQVDRESQRFLIGFRSHAALSPATFESRRLSTEFGTSTLSGLTVCTRVSAMGCRWGDSESFSPGLGMSLWLPSWHRANSWSDSVPVRWLHVPISHREDRDPGTMSQELITYSLSTYYSVSDVG